MIIDTNTSCLNRADFLVDRGVEVVGRYYTVAHPSYALTRAEAKELCSNGIKLFTVYEDHGHRDQFNLSREQGRTDAKNALAQAHAVGQPEGTTIYFAVEGLDNGYDTADLPGIRDYFSGIAAIFGRRYNAGVYGDGVVCKALLDERICLHTWLAQASYLFPGSKEFYASKRWNLAQIVVDLNWKRPREAREPISVDINEARGDIGSFTVPLDIA
jgi:hypothetical protein